MIVCDTGALVAAALVNDNDHEACVELFSAARAERRTLYVPATVVAVAERLRVSDLATIDHRDFSVIRPRHVRSFTLLP